MELLDLLEARPPRPTPRRGAYRPELLRPGPRRLAQLLELLELPEAGQPRPLLRPPNCPELLRLELARAAFASCCQSLLDI